MEQNGEEAALNKKAPEVQATKHRWPLWCAGIVVAVLGWNAPVTLPVMNALSKEEGVSAYAYRRWLLSPNQIVIDVWSVSGSSSMTDMNRRLFKAAEGLKDNSYENVVLAYQGKAKLFLDGPYFQEIGKTRQTQNSIYTMRTMQEQMSNPDGTAAFETWSGGWLVVIGQQLRDHREFHKRWWLNDAVKNL